MSKVLCIEDDSTIQTLVEETLKEFTVHKALTIKDANTLLNSNEYDAILIDIELPDGDGLRLLHQICTNEIFKKLPVIIMSGHADISNKVTAFSLGAEDFIAKPFDPIELKARMSAKIKKRQEDMQSQLLMNVGDILIDLQKQKAFHLKNNTQMDLNLTTIELRILSLLTKRMEQVFSRNQIMDFVWGDTFINDRTVDSHIAHLRQKITPTSINIESVKGVGYRAKLIK